jgi:hypothetical protein
VELEVAGSQVVDHIGDPQVVGYEDVVQGRVGSEVAVYAEDDKPIQHLNLEKVPHRNAPLQLVLAEHYVVIPYVV